MIITFSLWWNIRNKEENAGEPGKRDQESNSNAVASKDQNDEKDSAAPQANQRIATVIFDAAEADADADAEW